ncbi:DUF1152 domain-containing protein [Xanthocytophaga agilis]|uniref:DUF1152 domain-containing protein n=1 Tax=Xanthocytophaga agilis TaxID=3048010 RepID=A0AAE3R7E6_9BACT|nr:DUF1152 domain-containing protein [Xanthocytophaga agilis]MDJ1505124.1 DUF1152 domain-containing protein [Xanthocytophaga agilis]
MFKLSEIPLFKTLENSKSILLAGAGGGYDIYCGLPLYFALKAMGKEVHLANLSFTYLPMTNSEKVFDQCYLVKAGDKNNHQINYFPEKYLADWFLTEQQEQVNIYAFELSGVQPTKKIYDQIIERHSIDTVILIDGGTDSLMFGDEEELGTPLEDSCSLVAVNKTSVKNKLLVCLGFGVDRFHGVSHFRFLENTSKILAEGGFLGSFHLLPTMPEVEKYMSAVNYVNQHMERQSIVSNSIVSAIEGKFGDFHRTLRTSGSELWINSLMSIYWCYQVQDVVHNLKYYTYIANSQTRGQLNQGLYDYRQQLSEVREMRKIPV